MKIGSSDISKIYFGSTEVGKAYLGSDLVYGNTPFVVPYITDGLIFYLDGIEMGSTSGAWTDLIGGTVFTNNGATELSNGWYFAGSTSSYLSGNSITPTASSDFTVEVCLHPVDNTNFCVFILNNNSSSNYPLFYSYNNTITFIQRLNTYTLTSFVGAAHCVSLNQDIGCYDGQTISKNSGTDYWGSTLDSALVGKRGNRNPFKGTIYSIRVYNRRLTSAEMLSNQQIDNTRFNLGLSI